ncbi:MAG: hypothetical protein JSV88_04060 [Candidatus Aminicenantes bacterium]|nr:MAG: hypothetical protein JSV88_04060 [Candidatus Aminicenantes bacterium]
MTGLLKEAFDKASKLPETLQDDIAKELLAELEGDAPWKKISEHVKKLVEEGQIEDAREVLSTIQPGISTELDNWQRALANPKAKLEKSAEGGESIKEDALWLQDNSDKYKGNWIALKNGILLGAHESRIELRRSLKHTGKLAGAMFFRIDN